MAVIQSKAPESVAGFGRFTWKALQNEEDLLFVNERAINMIETANFGRLAWAEIGAMTVGRIVQIHALDVPFKRGDEKAMFQFGGSADAREVKIIWRAFTHFESSRRPYRQQRCSIDLREWKRDIYRVFRRAVSESARPVNSRRLDDVVPHPMFVETKHISPFTMPCSRLRSK